MTGLIHELPDGTIIVLDEHGHEQRPLSDLQLAQLRADLNPDRIASRGQGNSKVSYLQVWDVKRMLIKVFGFGGYSARLVESKVLKIDPTKTSQNKDAWSATATATMELHIHQLGATFSEAAASSQVHPQVGEAVDFALKTAESDALKRAAINLGTQYGLSLYNGETWVDVVGNVLGYGQRQVDQDVLRMGRLRDQATAVAELEKFGAEQEKDAAAVKTELRDDFKLAPEALVDDVVTDSVPDPAEQARIDEANRRVREGFTHPDVES